MDIKDLLNQQKEGNASSEPKTKSPLLSLKNDLDFYKESIQEVSSDIIEAELTQYPIFIAHQHEVNVGELILDRSDLGRAWSIHATTLEELMEANLILPDKKNRFIQQFKDPKNFMCLLVMVPEGANFVFYPYAAN